MQNLLDELKETLAQDERLIIDGKLVKNKIVELALKPDAGLLELLLSNERLKGHFFREVNGHFVYDKREFQRFVSNKNFLPDSYTAFKNKIGLSNDNGQSYLVEKNDVSLIWPYKDCVLEGGQTKEDAKRDEIFWNEILAPDQIDRLLSSKALTHFKKFDKDGEHEVSKFSVDDNLVIKGNNLLALHSLKKIYRGKVKLIYIDPPYNTGNDDFGYNDRFNHSAWMTFMKNRLKVAKELLTKEGVIFIHSGDQELHYLKVLTDQVFGRNKFIATIPRKTRSGKSDVPWKLSQDFDWMLIYTKDAPKTTQLFKRAIDIQKGY
jgi:adenine-specific DNA-methyltransferase